MKRKVKIISAALVCVMLLLLIAGCGGPANDIKGTWKQVDTDDVVLVFHDNGTAEIPDQFGGKWGTETYNVDIEERL